MKLLHFECVVWGKIKVISLNFNINIIFVIYEWFKLNKWFSSSRIYTCIQKLIPDFQFYFQHADLFTLDLVEFALWVHLCEQ